MTQPKEVKAAEVLRIPLVVITPIYGVLAAIVILGWSWQEADKVNRVVLAGLQKDSASTTRTLTRMERKVDGTYPRAEAEKEFQRVNAVLDDHETRLRTLEK